MLQLTLVVAVRGADQGAPQPRKDEDRPPAAGGNDGPGIHRQPVARERDVGTAARPDSRHVLGLVDLVRADPVGPHAGGVHHVVRAHVDLRATGAVRAAHPRCSSALLDQAGDLEAVREHGPEALGLTEHGQDEPRIVGLAVVEEVGGARHPLSEGGQELHRLVAAHGAVAVRAPVVVGALLAAARPAPAQPLRRHHVVQVEADSERPVGASPRRRGRGTAAASPGEARAGPSTPARAAPRAPARGRSSGGSGDRHARASTTGSRSRRRSRPARRAPRCTRATPRRAPPQRR